MRTLLVTSSLTFVPDNYEDFVRPLLESPRVKGLLLLDNRDPAFLAKGAALLATGAAPGLGWQICRNWFSRTDAAREEACRRLGKDFLSAKNPNAPDVVKWIRERDYDVILNARTRSIYRKDLLASAKVACLNIHHGLLPKQRGLMCDFWSHLEDLPVGFSVHVMTPKLDDGPILEAVEIETDRKDYRRSLRIGARREADVCRDLLEIIARDGLPSGRPNRAEDHVYRRNPGLADFYRLRWKNLCRLGRSK